MATVAVSPAVSVLRRPNVISICLTETKYEFLKSLRLPMYSVSTIVFPVMFYVLFGLIMGRQMVGAEKAQACLGEVADVLFLLGQDTNIVIELVAPLVLHGVAGFGLLRAHAEQKDQRASIKIFSVSLDKR